MISKPRSPKDHIAYKGGHMRGGTIAHSVPVLILCCLPREFSAGPDALGAMQGPEVTVGKERWTVKSGNRVLATRTQVWGHYGCHNSPRCHGCQGSSNFCLASIMGKV